MIHISKLMRYMAQAVFACGLLAVTPSALAQQSTASTIPPQVDEAITALRAVSTLRADFTQTDRNGQQLSGVLTLKRPGKIRFQYAPSIPMLMVSDGKTLTFIDYEVGQKQRWPIGRTPLGALLDPNKDVARFGRLKPTSDPAVISIEVRDRRHPEYGVITLIFMRKASAPGGLELVTWVMLDSQRKLTTIRLANHQYDVPIADTAFQWVEPRKPARR